MSVSLVKAIYTGVDTRISIVAKELCHIKVYSDTQFPIVVELKGNPKRYPYSSIETFLASWQDISKVAEMGH